VFPLIIPGESLWPEATLVVSTIIKCLKFLVKLEVIVLLRGRRDGSLPHTVIYSSNFRGRTTPQARLLQESQNVLSRRVRLGQGRDTCLRQNLELGQVYYFFGDVRISDLTLSTLQVAGE
jgi:hypothetical protein